MNELKAEEYLRELELDGELEEVEAGDVSQTYRVGDQYYLQFSDSAPVNLRRGILGLESQQDKDIPVPEIVYSDPEEPLLVTEALPGENIGRTNSEEVYRHVGEVMAEIHGQKFDQFGYMNVENGELVPSGGDDWTNTLSQIHHKYMSKAAILLDESKAAEIDSFFYEGIK